MKNFVRFCLCLGLLPGTLLMAQPPTYTVPLQRVEGSFDRASQQVGTRQTQDLQGFKGIPADLTEKVVRSSRTVTGQYEYERYRQGKLTRQDWDAYKQVNQLDTTQLSAKPIRQTINTLVGTDRQGRRVLIVDANNNQNFGDDPVIRYPMTLPAIPKNEQGLYNTVAMRPVFDTMRAVTVQLEAYDGRKIINRNVSVKPNPYNTGWLYRDSTETRFHLSLLGNEYQKGSATILNEPLTFRVVSGVPTVFRSTQSLAVAVGRTVTPDSIRYDKSIYRQNQSFKVNGRTIEITGLSPRGDALHLTDKGERAKE